MENAPLPPRQVMLATEDARLYTLWSIWAYLVAYGLFPAQYRQERVLGRWPRSARQRRGPVLSA